MNKIIEIKKISKKFKIRKNKKNTNSSFFSKIFNKFRSIDFDALEDISFDVNEGEFIGIIGRNGSGKSTLMKLISGIYKPTSGSIKINGKVAPFLELGVGFDPMLAAKQNVFLNGTALGMTRKEIENKYDEIVEFSELQEFLDLPIKNYSSGMKAKLGFSVAVQSEADVYLLDEVFAVGDEQFKKKSTEKIEELLSNGATVLFVSHNLLQIEEYCDRVIILDHGKQVFNGDVKEGIENYIKSLKGVPKIARATKRYLEQKKVLEKAKLLSIEVLDQNNKNERSFEIGSKFIIKAEIEALSDFQKLSIKLVISNTPTQVLCGFDSKNTIGRVKKGERVEVVFSDIIRLNRGKYDISFGIGDLKKDNLPFPISSKKDAIFVKSKQRQFGLVKSEIEFKHKIIKNK